MCNDKGKTVGDLTIKRTCSVLAKFVQEANDALLGYSSQSNDPLEIYALECEHYLQCSQIIKGTQNC